MQHFDLAVTLVEMVGKEIPLVVQNPNVQEVKIGQPLSSKLGIQSLWKA